MVDVGLRTGDVEIANGRPARELVRSKVRGVVQPGGVEHALSNEIHKRNATDALGWSRTATVGFSKPETRDEDIPFDNAPAPHAALMENFTAAVLDGAPLIAPGADGLHSVELANAIVHSSLLGQTVELPLDGAAWERKLQQLIAESRFHKEVRAVTSDDFAASFRR